ncbi:TIGR04388 family protein [Leptospira sp. 201903071]|nr:TIGR04388 family protein [Leptospira ainazelensis]
MFNFRILVFRKKNQKRPFNLTKSLSRRLFDLSKSRFRLFKLPFNFSHKSFQIESTLASTAPAVQLNNRQTRESDRSGNPAMHHRLLRCSLFLKKTNGASLIEAKSTFRVANSPNLSGGYTANASYDVNRAGGKAWANGSVNLSASKDGHASLALSYNHDGNTAIPQRLRGGGATLDLGNDGILGFSIQGLKGATVGNVNYNTNTHGWEKATLNQNFQNEYLQGVSAESSSSNHEKAQMEILHKEISLGAVHLLCES